MPVRSESFISLPLTSIRFWLLIFMKIGDKVSGRLQEDWQVDLFKSAGKYDPLFFAHRRNK